MPEAEASEAEPDASPSLEALLAVRRRKLAIDPPTDTAPVTRARRNTMFTLQVGVTI